MDVENVVKSESATENNVDAHKIPVYRGHIKVKDEPEDVFEKIKGTETSEQIKLTLIVILRR